MSRIQICVDLGVFEIEAKYDLACPQLIQRLSYILVYQKTSRANEYTIGDIISISMTSNTLLIATNLSILLHSIKSLMVILFIYISARHKSLR